MKLASSSTNFHQEVAAQSPFLGFISAHDPQRQSNSDGFHRQVDIQFQPSTWSSQILDRKDALFPGSWRPSTDNDKPRALQWRAFSGDEMTSRLRFMALNQKSRSHTLTLAKQIYIAPPSLGWGWHAATTYQIEPDSSAVSVFVRLKKPVAAVPQHLP